MPRTVHARVDRELDEGIERFARANGLTRSQAIRELLRQALGDPDPVSRGFKEGLAAGMREVLLAAHGKRP